MAAPSDPLTVYLVTIGTGDAIWERFGHNAIWIHDRAEGTDIAYNWGIFDFNQVGFIPRLIKGTMLYSMAPFDMGAMLRAYVASNRSVWAQELALTPEQEQALQAFVRWNALPENRDYHYDYYRDNCSTRVRDALDRVLGGALRADMVGKPTGTTYRWHTRRLLQDLPLAYAGIEEVLSQRADRPIDEWQEDFLPMQLRDHIRHVTVPDGKGGTRPLVVSERQLYPASRPEAPTQVDFKTGVYLAIGLALGSILLLLGWGGGSAAARVGLAVLGGLWALVTGVAGVVLVGAWLFTDHVFWYGNENLFQTGPVALVLAPLVGMLLLRRRPGRVTVALGLAVAGLSLLGFVLQALPWLDQVNQEIIAVTLPANLGLAGALWLLRRRAAVQQVPPAVRAAGGAP